jgi:hypothetical protein
VDRGIHPGPALGSTKPFSAALARRWRGCGARRAVRRRACSRHIKPEVMTPVRGMNSGFAAMSPSATQHDAQRRRRRGGVELLASGTAVRCQTGIACIACGSSKRRRRVCGGPSSSKPSAAHGELASSSRQCEGRWGGGEARTAGVASGLRR